MVRCMAWRMAAAPSPPLALRTWSSRVSAASPASAGKGLWPVPGWTSWAAVCAAARPDHLRAPVGRDPAHVVVAGRHDRDRLLGDVGPGEDPRRLRDPGQPL